MALRLVIEGSEDKRVELLQALEALGWLVLKETPIQAKPKITGKRGMLQALQTTSQFSQTTLNGNHLAAKVKDGKVRFALQYHSQEYYCGELEFAEFANTISSIKNTGWASAVYFGLVKPYMEPWTFEPIGDRVTVRDAAATLEWLGMQ